MDVFISSCFILTPSPFGGCVAIASKGGEAARFQSFRMRVFQIMGNRRLYKIKCLHTLGTRESDVLKVTALNLLHPTASPLFQKVGLFILRHNLSV